MYRKVNYYLDAKNNDSLLHIVFVENARKYHDMAYRYACSLHICNFVCIFFCKINVCFATIKLFCFVLKSVMNDMNMMQEATSKCTYCHQLNERDVYACDTQHYLYLLWRIWR